MKVQPNTTIQEPTKLNLYRLRIRQENHDTGEYDYHGVYIVATTPAEALHHYQALHPDSISQIMSLITENEINETVHLTPQAIAQYQRTDMMAEATQGVLSLLQ